MKDRPSTAELERTLRELGVLLREPEAPGLAARVRARLDGPPPGDPRWAVGIALAPAIVTLAILAAGATAAEVVRLRGVDVFRVPAVTAPPLRALELGERASVEAARALVPVGLPADAALGHPDEVYVRQEGGQVSLVYAPRPGLPAGPTGHGALLTALRGSLDATLIGKGVGPGSRIESVRVGGAAGIWIEGEAHFFFYRDGAGNIQQESLRLAGNTLLWERDGVVHRLEAQVGRERALEIAASLR